MALRKYAESLLSALEVVRIWEEVSPAPLSSWGLSQLSSTLRKRTEQTGFAEVFGGDWQDIARRCCPTFRGE